MLGVQLTGVLATFSSVYDNFAITFSAYRLIGLWKSRIPNLLANRLFLNLRSYQNPRYRLSSNDSTLPAPSFAQNRPNRFLGNIGEPLDYDQWDDFLEDEGVHDEAAGSPAELQGTQDPSMTLVPVVSAPFPLMRRLA